MKTERINEPLSKVLDRLQGQGRYVLTLSEALALPGHTKGGVHQALARLRKSGRIANPRRGFYVIVPLEYRSMGCLPASWFIDDLMRHLEQPYYAGLLSAAALHGAAHQQPMTFQVVTDRPTRPSGAGRVKVEFRQHRLAAEVPAVDVQTETGTMRVSTPEATAFDLVRYARACGGIGNVATVLRELAEKIRPEAMGAVAPFYAQADAQRLGYLLDALGLSRRADPLRGVVARRPVYPVKLDADKPSGGGEPRDLWKVIPNEPIEADS